MSTIYLLVLALVLVAASEFTSPPSTPGGFGPTPSPAPSGTPGGFGPTHSPAPSGTSSGFGPTPSPAPSGTPTPSATACDAICPVGTCDKPVDADKPECEACSQCHNGGAPSLTTPASSPMPVPSPFDPLVVPPPMNIPPQGFEAPKLLGAHFLAANPSKAVVLTFNVPTNEGGMLCFGYCLCSFLLDDETVRLLQVLRSPASFVPRAVSPMCLPRRCGTNIASRRRCATGR